jgi:hypothetical protein
VPKNRYSEIQIPVNPHHFSEPAESIPGATLPWPSQFVRSLSNPVNVGLSIQALQVAASFLKSTRLTRLAVLKINA